MARLVPALVCSSVASALWYVLRLRLVRGLGRLLATLWLRGSRCAAASAPVQLPSLPASLHADTDFSRALALLCSLSLLPPRRNTSTPRTLRRPSPSTTRATSSARRSRWSCRSLVSPPPRMVRRLHALAPRGPRQLTLSNKVDLQKLQTRNAPGSDRPSDPRKPMWINGSVSSRRYPPSEHERAADSGSLPTRSGPGGRGGGPGRGGRGGSGGPADFPRDRGYGPPAPGYGPPGPGYGPPRFDERPPYDRPPPPGYGPPPREFDRYGPPPLGPPMAPPPPGYGPPVDRPPYDPYYDRAPAYPPPYPAPVPGYPPPAAAPYDRPPYPAAAPPPPGAPGARDPYAAERYPPGPPGSGRSPVVPPRGSVPPVDPARAPYPPLDPYARPPPHDMPPSGAYDPRDERGAGARYQPYPPRDERGYGGRSPTRCVASRLSLCLLPTPRLTAFFTAVYSSAPPLERRRSMSPRRNGASDPYGRPDPYGPPPPGPGGYAPYDARGPPPMPQTGYGPPPGGRSPPRYPLVDEYVPRR